MQSNFLLSYLLLFISSQLLGQESNESIQVCDGRTLFTIVEQMPAYKGGNEQLALDLNAVLSFDKKIKEIIFIRSIVNCKGQILDIHDPLGENPEESEKIIDILSQLQNWEVGTQRGLSVDCKNPMLFKIKRGKIKVK